MKLSKIRITNYKSFADTGEIDLAPINVLAGRNNSGKSAFIHAAHAIQQGAQYSLNDIRLGTNELTVAYSLTDVSPALIERTGPLELGRPVSASFNMTRAGGAAYTQSFGIEGSTTNVPLIEAEEPKNFIYTYLSKRKVTVFDQVVNLQKTRAVNINLQNLVSKVDRLANPDYPKAQEYADLCRSVLGFRVSSLPSPGGHQAGIPVGGDSYIPLEAMGEGVSSLLGLITDLCMADGNLFLIEELENDIHPEGLKTILEVIVEKASRNQLVVSTHSNIVMKYLGSAQDAKVFNVEMEYQAGSVPTSTIHEIGPTAQARIPVLQQLGYELYDFDVWEGWLILEESSAEVVIRDYLIPWFTPRLSRIRTVSAGGTSKVGPVFGDFHRLFLFTHLQPRYQNRAWVIADGDESGREAVQRLSEKYSSWPSEHFRTWQQTDFERYYPEDFASAVDDALSRRGDEKRTAKKALLDAVKAYCDGDVDRAKGAFASSASEVIALLREIDSLLFGAGG